MTLAIAAPARARKQATAATIDTSGSCYTVQGGRLKFITGRVYDLGPAKKYELSAANRPLFRSDTSRKQVVQELLRQRMPVREVLLHHPGVEKSTLYAWRREIPKESFQQLETSPKNKGGRPPMTPEQKQAALEKRDTREYRCPVPLPGGRATVVIFDRVPDPLRGTKAAAGKWHLADQVVPVEKPVPNQADLNDAQGISNQFQFQFRKPLEADPPVGQTIATVAPGVSVAEPQPAPTTRGSTFGFGGEDDRPETEPIETIEPEDKLPATDRSFLELVEEREGDVADRGLLAREVINNTSIPLQLRNHHAMLLLRRNRHRLVDAGEGRFQLSAAGIEALYGDPEEQERARQEAQVAEGMAAEARIAEARARREVDDDAVEDLVVQQEWERNNPTIDPLDD